MKVHRSVLLFCMINVLSIFEYFLNSAPNLKTRYETHHKSIRTQQTFLAVLYRPPDCNQVQGSSAGNDANCICGSQIDIEFEWEIVEQEFQDPKFESR